MSPMSHATSPRTRAVLRKSRRRRRGDQTEIANLGPGMGSGQKSGRQLQRSETLLQLQKMYGNRSVSRMVQAGANKATLQALALQRKGGDSERIEAFVKEHPDHAHLLEGFADAMPEEAIIGQLLENFFSRTDFNYDFSEKAPFKHAGDCNTLVHEFTMIAKMVFGIPMEIKSEEGGFFIPGGGKIVHKNHVTGNIDDGKHFYFETHTWAVWKGKPIDVLFGQLGIVSHMKGVVVKIGQDNMPVWNANGFIFYLKHGATTEFDRYTSNFLKRLKL